MSHLHEFCINMVLRVRGLSLYLSFCQSACVCLSVCCPIDIYAACVMISSPATRVCMCVHVPVCGMSVLCVPWYQMMSACLGPLPRVNKVCSSTCISSQTLQSLGIQSPLSFPTSNPGPYIWQRQQDPEEVNWSLKSLGTEQKECFYGAKSWPRRHCVGRSQGTRAGSQDKTSVCDLEH